MGKKKIMTVRHIVNPQKEIEHSIALQKTGWWFGTFFIFPEILGMSSSQVTKSIIFQRDGPTTNQKKRVGY